MIIVHMKRYYKYILIIVVIMSAVGAIEYYSGRSFLGPDGMFGLWEGNIYSNEQSQRVFDPYSLTHILHGFGFYALLWLLVRKLPVRYRLVGAVILEGLWELLENSSFIINRYRAETIAIGYVGDSILNSLSDIVMMVTGFILAWRLKVWQTIVIFFAIETVLLFWIRDNLILNIIMLVYPVDAIKDWQSVLFNK